MGNLFQYFCGALLGWGLGANDSANVFGTAVSSRMVSYRIAVILTAFFVLLGALLQGEPGIVTLSQDLSSNPGPKAAQIAILISVSAAITMAGMTLLSLPGSCSQAVVGAIIGLGMMRQDVNFGGFAKVLVCWLGTPIGGAAFTFIFYYASKFILGKWRPTVFTYDPAMSLLLILSGCYGAYALGANNVANVAAIFVGSGIMSVKQAALFGGLAIAAGVVSYSKPVMMTVGKGIVKLDSFTAFICVLSEAAAVHIYAMVGVPVSTTQAIVGAVLGIGLIKGVHTVNYRMLGQVSLGWLATPFVAGGLAALGYFLANLHYQP